MYDTLIHGLRRRTYALRVPADDWVSNGWRRKDPRSETISQSLLSDTVVSRRAEDLTKLEAIKSTMLACVGL